MKSTSYVPRTDADKVSWLNNFSVKMPVYQTVLGLSTADVTQLTKDNAMYAFTVNGLNIAKQSQQNITAFKELLKHESDGQILGAYPSLPIAPPVPALVPAGIFDRVSLLVQRIKNASGYTVSIGQDLNIIAAASTIDIGTMTPELKGKLDVGRPHLKWQKGIADATDLYADHNDGTGFNLVGRFLRSEYLDLNPLAAGKVADEYKYKAVYVIADIQVGMMSQVFSITALKP